MSLTITGTFAYTEDATIREHHLADDMIVETNAIGGEIIKRGLYKYGFLNSALVQWYLDTTGHKRIKGDKSATKLCSTGELRKFTLERGHGLPAMNVYTLSDDTAEQMYRKQKGYREYDRAVTNKAIPYILENLSLAQFHILSLSNPKAQEQYYNHPVLLRDGRAVTIPSLIRYKSSFANTLFLVAMPLPKSREVKETSLFISRLMLIKEYFGEKQETYQNISYIIVCDSDEQIRDMATLIDQMADLKDIFIMYSRGSLWGAGDKKDGARPDDPLKKLYKCEIESGRADMSLVRFR